jgi:hypothetical protein
MMLTGKHGGISMNADREKIFMKRLADIHERVQWMADLVRI